MFSSYKKSLFTNITIWLPLLLVLLVAGCLRFYHLGSIPFMHDEFSALFRTEYNSFSDLIRLGVAENDTHPAGVQVFLFYWVKLFGFNEFWVKFPFALAGLVSVILLYLIGKKWFNETVALSAAAVVASTQYFVFYSQLARPYSAGLICVLWMVWQWTLLIKKEIPGRLDWMLFTASLLFTALMHAFSLFAAGLIYLSGFLFLRKEQWKPYIISALAAVLLYSPHIPVFWQQISRGDLGGWLGTPTVKFLPEFLGYSLNYSAPMIGIILSIIALSLLTADWKGLGNKRFRMVLFGWFVISFITAYLYSVLRSPLLQFSTLYFTFPFLILLAFSFFKKLSSVQNLFLVIIILLTGTSSLIFTRRHFDLMYHQGYDQSAKNAKSDLATPIKSIAVFYSATPRMHAFYLEKEGVKDYVLFSKHDKTKSFKELVSNVDADRFILSLADGGDAEWATIVASRFPFLLKHQVWFNTEYFVYSRYPSDSLNAIDIFENQLNLMKEVPAMAENIFNEKRIFGPIWQGNWDSICKQDQSQILSVTASGIALDTLFKARLVVEIKEIGVSEPVHWLAGTLEQDTILPGEHFLLCSVLKADLVQSHTKTARFRTYLWNPGKENFSINSWHLDVRPQSIRYYGIFEPL